LTASHVKIRGKNVSTNLDVCVRVAGSCRAGRVVCLHVARLVGLVAGHGGRLVRA
jgi:hypothetical protein